MQDMERAKTLLSEKNNTIALVKDDDELTSTFPGVRPMMEFIAYQRDLRGYSVADRVVGKAAAMLFVYAGINIVYGELISDIALQYLKKNNVTVSYGKKVPYIKNKQNTGMCPMEETVLDIDDAKMALSALKIKIAEMSQR